MKAFAVDRLRHGWGLALALVFVTCELTSATGFFINQQSVRGLGRVDAGNTVAADELGTIFFNPAGLTRIRREPDQRDRLLISIGTHLIVPRSTLGDQNSFAQSPGTLGVAVPVGGGDARNPTSPTLVPNFYAARSLAGGRAAVGLGVNAPFGLTTNFSPDWHGRYDAIAASLRTINVSTVGAYQFDSGLSVGGGLDVQHAKSSLTSAIPNPLAPGGPTSATDASIATTGDGYAFGFNVGVLHSFNEDTRLGVHYRSGMRHRVNGSAEITGLAGPLADFNGVVGARADLNLPAITTVGVMRRVAGQLVLFGEFEWFDWSAFDEVRIRFADGRPDAVRPANFRDAYAVAIGAESPMHEAWTLRGGVHYDTTPTVDAFRDTTVPDSERLWFGAGISFRATPNSSFDVAFNHVLFRDTAIALTRTFFDGTPLASAVLINSDVHTRVTTISIDYRYRF